MAHIGQQIKKVRFIKGIRQNELAKKIGVSNKRLSNWERGLSKPNSEMIDRICKALEIDYYDLADMTFEATTAFNYLDLHGSVNDEGYSNYYINQALIERFNALDQTGKNFVLSTLEHEEKRLEQLEKAKVRTLSQPIFTLAASAGTGIFLDSDQYELIDFPEDQVPRDSNFGVYVSGDSMEPDYPDGSIVFVKKTKSLEPGEIGIFILNEEGYIKKCGPDHNLISLNPKYQDIQISECDDCRIVGKVIGKYEEN